MNFDTTQLQIYSKLEMEEDMTFNCEFFQDILSTQFMYLHIFYRVGRDPPDK